MLVFEGKPGGWTRKMLGLPRGMVPNGHAMRWMTCGRWNLVVIEFPEAAEAAVNLIQLIQLEEGCFNYVRGVAAAGLRAARRQGRVT